LNLAILQARMTSSRLPGKVMADVLGQPMIGRQVERLRRAALIEGLVVATSVDPSDDPLAAYCVGQGIDVHRGPLDDVLGRFCGAVAAYPQAKTVIRLTADCPLADWRVIDEVIARHRDEDADYAANTPAVRTFPHGLDTEVVRASVLLEAGREAADPYEREHVTPFVYRRPERYRMAWVSREPSLSHLRWTVDVPTDLAFVRGVYEQLYPLDPAFGTEAIVALPVNSAEIPQ
jgi:spore coat polysaccharide biosynthesis protein SpsF